MDRYYRHSGFNGNVLTIWYDSETTRRAKLGHSVHGHNDAEIAEFVLGEYLLAQHDGFRRRPELQEGVELRCESRWEADHMARVMAQITQDTIPYKVSCPECTAVPSPIRVRQLA